MIRKNVFKATMVTLALLVFAPFTVLGQDACEAFLDQALNTLGTNCANQDLNSICYGYNGVDASFLDEEIVFAVPSDRADLNPLTSVRTEGLDEANNIWGIAVMRVQANLPQSLPGQATVLMMIGDVSVENQVSDTDAVVPSQVVPVSVAQTTDLLRFPPNFGDAVSRVVGVAASGETYQADGITADGAFVRVFYEFQEVGETSRRATAWLSIDSLEGFDTSALAVLTPDSFTPMQVFTVSTGVGQPSCAEAPDQLFVQGPENIETEIIVNGLEVTIASTLQVREVEGGIILVAVEGGITVTNDDGDDFTFDQGEVLFIPFGADGLPDINSAETRVANASEVEGTQALTRLPANLVNYIPEGIDVIEPSGIGR